MAGYTRQSAADITANAVIKAAPVNAELNALLAAFNASTGHKHDGTTAEGAFIPTLADSDGNNKIAVDTANNRHGVFVEVSTNPVEQVRFQDGLIVPVTDNDIDLGTSSVEYKNLYIDGTAYLDTVSIGDNDYTTITNNEYDVSSGNLTVDVAGDIILDADGGDIFVKDGGTTFGSLTNTSGNLIIKSGTTTAATFAGANVDFAGTVDITGATVLDSTLAVAGAGTVTGTLTATNNAAVGGTLAVTGATALNGGLTMDTNKFTVANTSGNVLTAGTMTVAGATALNGGLTMDTNKFTVADTSGNVATAGTLAVTGASTFTGAVTADAGISIDNITIDGTEIDLSSGDLTVDVAGDIYLNADGANIVLQDGSATFGSLNNSSGNLVIKSGTTTAATFAAANVDFAGTVDVTGAGTFDSTVAVAGVLSPATHVDMPDDAKIKIGTGDDLNIYHDGSDSYIDNATGALNVATGTSGIAINIGHGTSEVTVGDNLTVAGNLTVQGTQTVVDTVTMNAANAIVFEGATADDHETTLTIVDPTADRTINLPNQSGTIPVLAAASNTAITSTPAELNILDGVTATTAEINLLDGGTSASSVTVVDADRVLLNDNGTMKQVAVTDLAAYFDDEITAMPNLVSTGALNSGSITSGFGTIDNGSSAITTTGTVNFGSLSDGTITVTGFVDEDNMASDSATLVPTQQSVLAYITATMGSVTSAANSATAAAASYDSFDDRYLGAKSSAPSVDNDGNSLITGALYFNSSTNVMNVRTSGGGWTAAGSNVNGTSSRETYAVGTNKTSNGGVSYTGSTTSFPATYDAPYVDVYLNGVKMLNGTDVTVTSGTAVVLAAAGAAGDIVDIVGYGTFTLSNQYTKTESDAKYATKASPTFTGTATFSDGNITNVGNIALDSLTADGSTITITGNTTFADGAYDFDIASHDTSNGLKLGGTLVTATAAELNILDGVTSTAAELNILDGVTSTAAELNILDGVTSTATELNLVDGATAGTIVNSKAVVYSSGGQVNATTLAIAGTAITSTAAELNILDGKSFVDEDNMSSNSATAIASQQSVKAYVDSSVATAASKGFAIAAAIVFG